MRKYLLFGYLFISTFIKRHKRQLLISSVSGFFLTLLTIQAYPVYIRILGRRNIKIGIVGTYTVNSIPLDIQNLISLGLTKLAVDGSAQGSISEKWDIGSDGKEYTFYLQRNLIWHDGKPFKSSDFSYKIKGATIEYPQDNIIKISLKDSYAPLPVMLSHPLIRPGLIGLGIYKVTRVIQKDENIKELYLDAVGINLPSLTYKFYPSKSAAILAFKLGEIEQLKNIDDVSDLSSWNNAQISENIQYDRIVTLFFNLKDARFKEKEIRQALSYAIPKMDNFEKAVSPISPLSWAYSRKIRLYNYDLESALKILAKSPLSSGSQTLTISTNTSLLQTVQFIADSWKKAGINTKVKVDNDFSAAFDVLLVQQQIPKDPDQYHYWQSTQSETNITNYNSPKIDKLLEEGRKTNDLEARKKIYTDFQLYLVDDAPAIFLYYPKIYSVTRM